MANLLVKDYRGFNPPSSPNSQSGDEAFLDALSTSVTGFDSSWSTPISLDGGSSPEGITTTLVNSEYRVTQVDLRSNMNSFDALSGSINIPEWENIKECTLINVAFNNFVNDYPSAIHKIGSNLEYLYLNYSDDQISGHDEKHPHEYYPATGLGFEAGKESSQYGDNTIKGTIPDDIDNLTGLKGFVIAFPDNWGISNREPIEVNGIDSVPPSIWNISTMQFLVIYDCWNIGANNNTLSFPTNLNMSGLKYLDIGGGNGSQWDPYDQGFLTGAYPTDIDNLPDLHGWNTSAHEGLTGLPDLSSSTLLTRYKFSETDFGGDSFPTYVVDGTLPDMDVIHLTNPTANPLEGTLPETWECYKADSFGIGYNNFTGAVPTQFWDIDMRKMNIRYNNFTSIGRTDLTNLVTMINLRYYGNDVEGENIPYIDWTRSGWNYIDFQLNRYVFQDMLYVPPNAPNGETALELYLQLEVDASMSSFSYGSQYGQKPAGTANTYSSTDGNGDIVIDDFDTTYGHTDNSYQWQKSTDGGSSWSDITDATSKTYTITGASSSDNGIYRVKVNNSTEATLASNYGKSSLTLTSKEITVSL